MRRTLYLAFGFCLLLSAGCAQVTGLPATTASPALPSATATPQPSTRSLSVILNTDALTAEQRQLLAGQNVTVRIQDDLEAEEPQENPQWRYKTETTLSGEQQAIFEQVPVGLRVNISVVHTLQPPTGPCSTAALSAIGSVSVLVTEQLAMPVTLRLSPSLGADLAIVCGRASLQGQIYNTEGQPVAAAQVRVRSLSAAVPFNEQAEADSNGAYRFNNTPPGVPLEIEVSAIGYTPQKQTVQTQPDKQDEPMLNTFDFGGAGNEDTALAAVQ